MLELGDLSDAPFVVSAGWEVLVSLLLLFVSDWDDGGDDGFPVDANRIP